MSSSATAQADESALRPSEAPPQPTAVPPATPAAPEGRGGCAYPVSRLQERWYGALTRAPSGSLPSNPTVDFMMGRRLLKAAPPPNNDVSPRSNSSAAEEPAHLTLIDLLLSNLMLSIGSERLVLVVAPAIALLDDATIPKGLGAHGGHVSEVDALRFESNVLSPAATHLVDTLSHIIQSTTGKSPAAVEENVSALFAKMLRSALENLPTIMTDEGGKHSRNICCQVRLLGALVRVCLEAHQRILLLLESAEGLKQNLTTVQLLRDVCSVVLNTTLLELLDRKRLQHVFRLSVIGTTTLTQLFAVPLLSMQYIGCPPPNPLTTAAADNHTALGIQQQYPSIFLKCCARFLHNYRKSFVHDRAMVQTGAEASAWFDSMVVVLRGYLNALETMVLVPPASDGQPPRTPPGGVPNAHTGVDSNDHVSLYRSLVAAAEEVLTTMTATDVDEHLRSLLIREKQHQALLSGGENEADPQALPGNTSASGTVEDDFGTAAPPSNSHQSQVDDSNETAALLARVRPKRSLFGTSTVRDSGDGVSKTDLTTTRLAELVSQSTSTAPKNPLSAPAEPLGVGANNGRASARFVKRGGRVPAPSAALSAVASPTSATAALPYNASSSPLVSLFVQCPPSLLRTLQQYHGRGASMQKYIVYGVEAQGVLLARSADRLWRLVDRLEGEGETTTPRSPTDDPVPSARGTLHHLATQVETFSTVILRALSYPNTLPRHALGTAASSTPPHRALHDNNSRVNVSPSIIEGSGWLQGDTSVRMLYQSTLLWQRSVLHVLHHSKDHPRRRAQMVGFIERYSACGEGPSVARGGRRPRSSLSIRSIVYRLLNGDEISLAQLQADAAAILTPKSYFDPTVEGRRHRAAKGVNDKKKEIPDEDVKTTTMPLWLQVDCAVFILRVAHASVSYYSDQQHQGSGGGTLSLRLLFHPECQSREEEDALVGSLVQSALRFLGYTDNDCRDRNGGDQARSTVPPPMVQAMGRRDFAETVKYLTLRCTPPLDPLSAPALPSPTWLCEAFRNVWSATEEAFLSYWVPQAAYELMDDLSRPSSRSSSSADQPPSSLQTKLFSESHALQCLAVMHTISAFLPSRFLFGKHLLLNQLTRYCGRVLAHASTSSSEIQTMKVDDNDGNDIREGNVAAAPSGLRDERVTSTLAILLRCCVRDRRHHQPGSCIATSTWTMSDMFRTRVDLASRRVDALQLVETRRRQRQIIFLLTPEPPQPSSSNHCDETWMCSGRESLWPMELFSSSGHSRHLNHQGSERRSDGGGDGVVALPPLFPAVSRDTKIIVMLSIVVEAHAKTLLAAAATSDSRGAAAAAEDAAPAPPTTEACVDSDLQACFMILARSTLDPWTMMDRAFRLERRVRLLILPSSSSNSLLQLRTQMFLHLFAIAHPHHISAAPLQRGVFTQLVSQIEDFLCLATPVTLLGVMRDGPRALPNIFPSTNRLLRAQFFAVKQVLQQLSTMEKDLEELFVLPTTTPSSWGTGELEGEPELHHASSTSSPPTTVVAPQREQRSYRELHHTFLYTVIAVTDLIVDCFRTHGFQKTLDASLRALLNHALVTCCQIFHRIVSGSGSTGPRAQQRYGTLGHMSLHSGIDGVMTVAATAIGCFFSALLISDARHAFLDTVSKHAVSTLLSSMHRFVCAMVDRCAAAAATVPEYVSRQEEEDHHQLSAVLVDFSHAAPRGVRLRCGFGKLSFSNHTKDQHHHSSGSSSSSSSDGNQGEIEVSSIHRVLDALLSMALTSTLLRHSPLPGDCVHRVMRQVQSEMKQNTLRAEAAIRAAATSSSSSSPKNASKKIAAVLFGEDNDSVLHRCVASPDLLKSFQSELSSLEERIDTDLENAKKELAALEQKIEMTTRHVQEQQQGGPIPDDKEGATVDISAAKLQAPHHAATHVADAAYLSVKVRTLQALAALPFVFSEESLSLILAGSARLAPYLKQSSAVKRSSMPKFATITDDDDVDDDDAARLLVLQSSNSTSTHTSSSAGPLTTGDDVKRLLCSGPAIPIEDSLVRFNSMFNIHRQRFRSTSTLSRRNALATEIVAELHGMVCRYGLLQLVAAAQRSSTAHVATFLRSMRTAKRFKECDALCEVIADQLHNEVNEPEREIGWKLLTLNAEYHKKAMEKVGQLDPSTYASRVSSKGLCPGDLSRYQAEEDLTVLEALASRLEEPPQVVLPTSGDGGKARLEWSASSAETEPLPCLKHHLPASVLFTLVDEVCRLGRECLGARRLLHELAVYCVRRFIFPMHRVGPRSSIYAAGVDDRLLPLDMSDEEMLWWRRFHPNLVGSLSPWKGMRTPSAAPDHVSDETISAHVRTSRDLCWSVQRNAAIILGISARFVSGLAKHRSLGDLAEFHRSISKAMSRPGSQTYRAPPPRADGGRPNNSAPAKRSPFYSPLLRGLQQRRMAARMRLRRLTDPASVEENHLESFLIASQQWMIKLLLFGDLASVRDAHMLLLPPSASPTLTTTTTTTTDAKSHEYYAKALREIGARSTLDAIQLLSSELMPGFIRKAVVPPLSVFVCVTSTATASTPSSVVDNGAAPAGGSTTDVVGGSRNMQCPTLYELATLTALTDLIPKVAEGCSTNFTATVASILNERMNERPHCPLGPVLRVACTISHATWRRSQILVSLLYRLCGVMIDSAQTRTNAVSSASAVAGGRRRRSSSSSVDVEESFASPFLVSEEEVAVFIATIARSDIRLPQELIVQTVQHFFRQRRDIFGDPPVPLASNPLANTSGTKVPKLPSQGGAASESGGSSAPAALRRDDDDASATNGEEPNDNDVSSGGEHHGTDPLQSAAASLSASLDLFAGAPPPSQGHKVFMDYSIQEYTNVNETHKAAIHALNFNVEQLMMLIMAYASRIRIPRADRLEATDLIRVAAAERRNRLMQAAVTTSPTGTNEWSPHRRHHRHKQKGSFARGTFQRAAPTSLVTFADPSSSSPTSTETEVGAQGEQQGSVEDPFALRIAKPGHFGVVMLHHQFALRKLLHAAARKTGVVQAPHTLADIVEALHEAEDLVCAPAPYTKGGGTADGGAVPPPAAAVYARPLDGMLRGTFRVLSEWALLRVEDAGCDGVEDRNQFVTPAGRLFGDVALRYLKRRRKDKEQREFMAEKMETTRQWRVGVKKL